AHALFALEGLGSLEEPQVTACLSDSHPRVREHAVKLSERFYPNGIPSEGLWSRLKGLVNDPDINVRYQLAFTLGEIKLPGKMDALEQLIIRDHASSWLQAAVLSSLSQGAAELFVHLARATDFRDPTAGQKFLRQLSTTVGSKNEPSEVAQVLSIASQMGAT